MRGARRHHFNFEHGSQGVQELHRSQRQGADQLFKPVPNPEGYGQCRPVHNEALPTGLGKRSVSHTDPQPLLLHMEGEERTKS